MAGPLAHPGVALAPLFALAANTLGHVAMSRLRAGRKPMVCLASGALIGLVVVTGLSAALLRDHIRDLDSLATLLMNLLTYLALAYGYFHFVNLNLASLRIRLLAEIGAEGTGLAESAIFAKYNSKSVITARVRRLTAGHHLVEREGRYFLGKNRVFLLLYEIFEVMKFAILGRGSRLLMTAGVERGMHPILALIVFFWNDKFFRFIIVGMLNTVFSYSLYAVLVLLGLGFRAALTTLTIITIIFNFVTYGRLVFHDKRKRIILKFLCVYALLYGINERLLTLLVAHHVGAIVAQGLLLPFIVVISFTFNRRWVFRSA